MNASEDRPGCAIGLTRIDLQSIQMMLNCGHDAWIEGLSGAGEELLRRSDLLLALVKADGLWQYRTEHRFDIQSRKGRVPDCALVRRGLEENPVYQGMTLYFSQRTASVQAFTGLVRRIHQTALPGRVKENLEAALGLDLQHRLGTRLPEMFAGGAGGEVEKTLQKAVVAETERLRSPAAPNLPLRQKPACERGVGRLLADPTLWRNSAADPDVLAARTAPGMTLYLKWLDPAQNRVSLLGKPDGLERAVNEKVAEIYCGIGAERTLYRLGPSDLSPFTGVK